MKNWKIWTAFLAVFAAGILIGVVSIGLVIQHNFPPKGDHAAFREKMKSRFMTRFIDKVEPDTKDIPAIEAIMTDTISKLEKVRMETDPKVKAILKNGEKRIKLNLTGEQAKRFDEMIENHKKRRFNLLRLPPPPPPIL